MLGEAFSAGSWKNIVEMEEELTLDELTIILKAEREKAYELKKFYAAFKGMDLDEETGRSDSATDVFAQTRMAADAALAGKSTEHYVFDMIGIDVDIDDDLLEEMN